MPFKNGIKRKKINQKKGKNKKSKKSRKKSWLKDNKNGILNGHSRRKVSENKANIWKRIKK